MQAGHKVFVGYAVETGTITESPDGITPAELPAAPSGMAFVGFSDVPDQNRGLNNSYGFGVGRRIGQYIKRGSVMPSLSIRLRAGSLGLIQKAVPVNDVLPRLCFWVGVPGLWTDVYRDCKIGTLGLSGRQSDGEAAEIEAMLGIQAQVRYGLTTPLNPSMAALAGLATPLMWGDLRGFNITSGNGTVYPQRLNLTAFNANIDHKLLRGVSRPDFGDDSVTARTTSEFTEGTLAVSGDMSVNKRLPESLFTGSQRAQTWGDIPITISDVTQTKKLDWTFKRVVPGNETGQAVDPGSALGYGVPFTASDFELAVLS